MSPRSTPVRDFLGCVSKWQLKETKDPTPQAVLRRLKEISSAIKKLNSAGRRVLKNGWPSGKSADEIFRFVAIEHCKSNGLKLPTPDQTELTDKEKWDIDGFVAYMFFGAQAAKFTGARVELPVLQHTADTLSAAGEDKENAAVIVTSTSDSRQAKRARRAANEQGRTTGNTTGGLADTAARAQKMNEYKALIEVAKELGDTAMMDAAKRKYLAFLAESTGVCVHAPAPGTATTPTTASQAVAEQPGPDSSTVAYAGEHPPTVGMTDA